MLAHRWLQHPLFPAHAKVFPLNTSYCPTEHFVVQLPYSALQ